MTTTAQPQTRVHPGQLPPFWDRSAVFVANIHSIFFGNAAGTESLEAAVQGIEAYGCRLVPLVELMFPKGGNLLVVEAEPQPALVRYFRDGLGLRIPEIEVARLSFFNELKGRSWRSLELEFTALLRRIASHPAPWIDGFVTDDGLEDFAALASKRTLSSVQGSRQGNNKHLLHAHLESIGLPVFETRMAAAPGEVAGAAKPLFDAGYRFVVAKAQVGASGIGILKLGPECLADPAAVPGYLFHEGPCMIQGWLDETVPGVKRLGSPSVQLFLTDDSICLYDTTEQLLSEESVHQGNISPPPCLAQRPECMRAMLAQAASAAEWLHGRGYRGPGSVDFLVIDRGGGPVPIACEINARVTGATYPSVLARHFLPGGAWLMCNLMFAPPMRGDELFESLRRAGLLFEPGLDRGVVPVNFVPREDGLVHKGQFLCLAGDAEDCGRLLEEVEGVLPAEWKFSRD